MILPYRIGHGYDLHRLEEGFPLIIGGERIEYHLGCAAHSDGDVVFHAVTDAILGALGQEDIGQLFPDNQDKWKSADSSIFIKEASERMTKAGYVLGNIDVTVVLEKPKLSPHKKAIKQNLARYLNCQLQQVNIKGKTHEKVDAVGENRAIECHVAAMLVNKNNH